jgi:hypothetical protein
MQYSLSLRWTAGGFLRLGILRLMVRYEVFLRVDYCLNLLRLVLCPDHLDAKEALQWCGENKAALKKSQVSLNWFCCLGAFS